MRVRVPQCRMIDDNGLLDDNPKKRAEFFAYIPPIKSAILLSGNGDGAQMKLEIPETEVQKMWGMANHWRGRNLKVVIEIDE